MRYLLKVLYLNSPMGLISIGKLYTVIITYIFAVLKPGLFGSIVSASIDLPFCGRHMMWSPGNDGNKH